MAKKIDSPLAKIPQVEILLSHPQLDSAISLIGRPMVAKIVTKTLNTIRKKARTTGTVPSIEQCIKIIQKECAFAERKKITRLINATGVILHTNIGRSPLPEGIWDAAKGVASTYSSIEIDLTDGKRGTRFSFLLDCMKLLTGAEDAVVVNNNAASVFLMLKAFAEGREVIVSRGQQVQIGGGFRIPDILRMAGCTLIEVGTTNITSLKDITQAITPNTAMVLWVHTSNYKIRGFVDMPSIAEIKKALPEDIIFAVDQGTGNLNMAIPEDPTVPSILKDGADIVAFSGDKILGGPQCGWIVGKPQYIQKIAKNPLMRTYRIGRAVAALMETTLVHYLNGGLSTAQKALALDPVALQKRGKRIVAALPKNSASLVSHPFSLGGGSTPDIGFPSWAIQFHKTDNSEKIKTQLREMPIPIICFIMEDHIMIHLASIEKSDDPYLIKSLITVIEGK